MSKWLEGGVDREVADRATETFGPHTAPVQEEEAAAARQSWQGAVPSGGQGPRVADGEAGTEGAAGGGQVGEAQAAGAVEEERGQVRPGQHGGVVRSQLGGGGLPQHLEAW